MATYEIMYAEPPVSEIVLSMSPSEALRLYNFIKSHATTDAPNGPVGTALREALQEAEAIG